MSPARNVVGGSLRTFGNRKRTVPSVIAIIVAVKAIHAPANAETMPNSRRSTAGAGLAAAGFGGIATFGAGGGAVAVTAAPVDAAGGVLVGSDMAVCSGYLPRRVARTETGTGSS